MKKITINYIDERTGKAYQKEIFESQLTLNNDGITIMEILEPTVTIKFIDEKTGESHKKIIDRAQLDYYLTRFNVFEIID